MKKLDSYSLAAKMRKSRRGYPLTATEQALYYELIAICNEVGWAEVFPCSCYELCNALQISENTLKNARVTLINVGLISYSSGKSKRQFSKYSFPTTSKFEGDAATKAATNSGTYTATDADENLRTIINSKNKTKSKTILSGARAPAKGSEKKKKSLEETVMYWKAIVDVWFEFYKLKYELEPTFNGATGKSLKGIIDRVKKMSEASGKEWTEEFAKQMMLRFFTLAYADPWLKDNFLLSNLYSKFDSIVTKASTNGTTKQATGAGVEASSLVSRINEMSAGI